MKITTLTLNPAFDLHCYADAFLPQRENLFEITARDAGGKGVNVSRALKANGVENAAVCIVGSENGEEFLASLRAEGLTVRAVKAAGRIRENITLHEKEKAETRISFKGFAADEGLLAEVLDALGDLGEGSTVVFSGRAPEGLTEAALVAFLKRIKDTGASLAIDSRALSLSSILSLRPMLIKPNKGEAEAALGVTLQSIEDAREAAETLHKKGVENVLLSLGGEGAILCADSGIYYAPCPEVAFLSTVGAGDSTVAGFLSAKAEGLSDAEALARAVAFGSAACMLAGTAAPRREDVAALIEKIKVQRL